MNDTDRPQPCPQCNGCGFLVSSPRRYKPLCHHCRGRGVVERESGANRHDYFAQYQRDVINAVRVIEEQRSYGGVV